MRQAGRLPAALLMMSAADAIGSGLFLPAAVLFFTHVADLSTLTVGIGLSVAGVAGICGLLPTGALIARFGARRALSGAYIASLAGYLLYPTVHSPWTFLPIVCGLRAADRAAGAATTVLISDLVDAPARVRVLSLNRAIRNAGWVLGSGTAGVAIAIGSHEAYLALVLGNAASYGIGWILLQSVLRPLGTQRTSRMVERDGAGYRSVLRDHRYVAVTGLGSLTGLLFSIQAVGLPLWVVHRTSAPMATIGALFAFNAVLVALMQVPAGRRVRSVSTAGKTYRHAGLLVATACLLYDAAASVPTVAAVALLTAAVLLLSLGEVLSTAAGFALSLGLAPPGELPRYVAFSFVGSSVQDAIGPATITALILGVGQAGWFLLAVLVAAPAAVIALLVRARTSSGAEAPQPSSTRRGNVHAPCLIQMQRTPTTESPS